MEVHFTPDIQAQLDRFAAETCHSREELVQDAMAGYLDELAQVRDVADSRYDDIKKASVAVVVWKQTVRRSWIHRRGPRWRRASACPSPRRCDSAVGSARSAAPAGHALLRRREQEGG
jgi:hypothetical protein